MKAVLCFAVVLIRSALTDMAGECDLAVFYTELGCTPVFSADHSTMCPEAFTCPDLHPNPAMCYYRGEQYHDQARIPQARVMDPCSQLCTCDAGGSEEPRIQCAVVDCVELFDADTQHCIDTFQLNSCCSFRKVCDKDEIAALKTCQVDDETYREGQQFEPKGTRKVCVCTGAWNGSTDNPEYCRDISCGIEINYHDKLLEGCAPIFAGSLKMCPIAFQCPSDATKVIRGLNIRTVGSQCVFGNLTLSVGDELTTDETCTKCSCDVPPFVSCIKQYSCTD